MRNVLLDLLVDLLLVFIVAIPLAIGTDYQYFVIVAALWALLSIVERGTHNALNRIATERNTAE